MQPYDRTWQVLLVEDNEDDYIITRGLLHEARRGNFELIWTRTYAEALDQIGQCSPDVMLVDYYLGAETGLDFLRAARAEGYRTPAIMLTGQPAFTAAEDALQAGVSDYLEKDQLTGPLLVRAIRFALERQQSQENLERANQELEARVEDRTRDLTAAYNHLAEINARLEQVNALLENVFSSIHNHIAYLDRDFNFIRVNRRFAELDGHTEDFFPGKNYLDLYPNPENEVIFRRVVETGLPYIAYARPLWLPGNLQVAASYWDWRLMPVKDAQGSVTGLIFNLLDVTEQQLDRQAVSYQAYLLENISNAIVAKDADMRYTSWNRAAEKAYGWKRGEVIGKTPIEVLQTRYIGVDFEGVKAQLASTGAFFGEAIQTCRDGREVLVEMKMTALWNEQGLLTGYVGIHHDITEQRKAEEQIQRNQRRLESQAELTRLLSETRLDNHKMLQILAQKAAELIGDACVVTQLAPDGQALNPVAYHHANPEALQFLNENPPAAARLGEGFSGLAAQQGAPLLIADVDQERLREGVNPGSWPYLDRQGLYSVLIVPLKINERVFGTLGVTRDQPGRPYTEVDQLFLETLAGRAALWVQNAELYETAQRELAERRRVEEELNEIQSRLLDASEAERLNLARELHDGPIQELYGLEFQLHSLATSLPSGDDNETMVILQTSIQRVIESLRNTSVELRPPVLARFGLGPAIRSHCETLRKTKPGFTIHLDVQNNDGLSGQPGVDRIRLAMFRIFQVALTNVVRHSHATQVTVRLLVEQDDVILEISDNGVGFRVPERWVELARQGHLGLVGARERTEALGGTLQVISHPGEGTTIRVRVSRTAASS